MNLPHAFVPLYPLPVDWLRGPARIDGDWIVLNERHAETYRQGDPNDVGALIFDLGALETIDDALAFTRRHGLLRHGPTSKAPRREKWSDWKATVADFRATFWLQQRLRAASMGDDAALDWLRRAMPVPSDAKGSPTREQLLQRGAAYLSDLITAGMSGGLAGGTPSGIAYGGPENGYVWTVEPLDLVQHAYVRIAIGIVRNEPARACEECGQFFVPKDARQRFHSDTCASRNRGRRFRGTRPTRRMERGKTRKR